MAKTPKTSDYTSVKQRIETLKSVVSQNSDSENAVPLMPLLAESQQAHPNSFAFSLGDYLALVEWAGRAVCLHKRGYIEADEQPVLERLNVNVDGFWNQAGTCSVHFLHTVLPWT